MTTQRKTRGVYSVGQATRESILSAAMVLIAERGYNGFSLRDLGRRVGISHPAVVYHQKQLAGDELVAALEGFFFRGLQQLDEVRAGLHLILPLHLGQAGEGRVQLLRQLLRVHAGALQERARAAFLRQHGR